MKDFKHLKKKKVLVQFSDGSVCSLFVHIEKKELLFESDIRSKITWKDKGDFVKTDNLENKEIYQNSENIDFKTLSRNNNNCINYTRSFFFFNNAYFLLKKVKNNLVKFGKNCFYFKSFLKGFSLMITNLASFSSSSFL